MANSIFLVVNGQHGQFVAQVAAEMLEDWDISQPDLKILLAGPDDPQYWETWERVLNNAVYIDQNGRRWQLHHDSDLWACCDELMSDDEYFNLFGEDRPL